MRRLFIITFTLLVFSLGIMVGCSQQGGGDGGDDDYSDASKYFDPLLPAGVLSFEVSPAATSEISYIIALGNLNPPDHALPTDHIYFVKASSEVTVYAPAGGKVLEVSTNTEGPWTEHSIIVGVTSSCAYYMIHITLDPVLSVGQTITAGQVLGEASPLAAAFDLGMVNANVSQPFVNRNRYLTTALNCDAPLKYFKEPIKSQLYSLVQRTGSDKDGKICYDQAGKLIGNWFMEGLPNDSTVANRLYGSMEAAFVYSNYYPTSIEVSIGGTIFTSGRYYVQADAVDPANVTTSSEKITYHLYSSSGNDLYRMGLLIVQMLADDKIKAEAFEDTTSETKDFTSAAKIYLR